MAIVSDIDRELSSLLSCEPEQSAEGLAIHCSTFVPVESSVQMLADACRAHEWRAVIADSGYLAKVLDAFGQEVIDRDQGLALQMLRLICNAVAEIDKNRDLAIPHLPQILEAVTVDGLKYAALSCILNICQDYDAGEDALEKLDIFKYNDYLVPHTATREEVQVTLDLLSIAAQGAADDDASVHSEEGAAAAAAATPPPNPLCPALVSCAVQAATHAPGVVHPQHDFLRCASALLDLFETPAARALLTSTSAGPAGHGGAQRRLLLDLLESCAYRLENRRRRRAAEVAGRAAEPAGEEGEQDEVASLEAVADQLVALMADVGAQWDVVPVSSGGGGGEGNELDDDDDDEEDDVHDDVEGELAHWLAESAAPAEAAAAAGPGTSASPPASPEAWRLARGAALMLGNAARSDGAAVALLARSGGSVASAAAAVAARAGLDTETRHAAAGLLRNLAVARRNRRALARRGAWAAALGLLAAADEGDGGECRLREIACRLLRVLLRDERANCAEFLEDREGGSVFDGFMRAVERDALRMEGVRDDAAGVRAVVVEAGRVVVSLCRTVALGAEGGEIPEAVAGSSVAATAVFTLAGQAELAAKSEAFMGLALLSRSGTGAATVCAVMTKAGMEELPAQALASASASDEPLARSLRDNVSVMAQNLVNSGALSDNASKDMKRLIEENMDRPNAI